MKLSFWGAARVVTGSCHRLTACSKNILIDCGLQQGRDEIDNTALPFHPGSIDVVLVTHAHIDHSGRIPMLIKNGFQGKIIPAPPPHRPRRGAAAAGEKRLQGAYLCDTGNLRPLKDHAAGQRPDTGKRCPVESKEK